ncbi:bacitracin ABC transporter ATP-binding protein [Neobacillus niacini]
MSKRKKPLLSDEFLDELANEINLLSGTTEEQIEDNKNDENEK